MADQITEIKSGFFDAVNNDRTYSADEMNRPYKRVIAEGIFATPQGTPSTDLQVLSASNAMNIIVKKGEGLLGGKWFENETDFTITVPANNNIVPRRDSVIIQVDNRTAGRNTNIIYREGTPASNPQVPNLSTNEQVVERRIANIYVAANSANINQNAIVDLRGSSECPWITSLIQQVDTSTLYDQYRAAYDAYYSRETELFNSFMSSLTQQLTVSTSIVKYESHYHSTAPVSDIPINIAAYKKSTDVLMVRVNRLFTTEGVDYTIASDGKSIYLATILPPDQDVDFLVLQSVVMNADATTILESVQGLSTEVTNIGTIVSNATTDSGWIDFTLQNGATAYSTGLAPSYRKYGKAVYVRGCIKGVTANGTIFATLPSGYQPAMTRYYTLATGTVTMTIEIGTNGQMKIANTIGSLTAATLIPIDTQFIIG